MNDNRRAYLELHLAVFLFGFTAILGDLIQLPALVIVWWRVLLTSISLLFLVNVFRLYRSLPRRTILQFSGIGVLVALHWLAFFGAVQLANASISLICMATTSFFTAFLEPLLLRQRVKGYEIFLGILIIPGMALVVNNVATSVYLGIVVGLLSAFLAALFGTLNKKMIDHSDSLSITYLELSSAWLFLSLVLPFFYLSRPEAPLLPEGVDWLYLLALALVCTTFAYVLALRALRFLSAFASNLTINLEPVYGILLAIFILREDQELTPGFYLGVGVILLAVFSYPLFKKWALRRKPVND